MKMPSKHFDEFIHSILNTSGKCQIVESRVPLKTQLEFYQYSNEVKDDLHDMDDNEYQEYKEFLENPECPMTEKKKRLALLALSTDTRAYRLLEKFQNHADEEMKNWASMALIESRISIENELMDESQIYISTGMGGKDDKFRYYALFLTALETPFEDYQRDVIKKEFEFILQKNDSEIERLTIHDRYVELVVLMPFFSEMSTIFEEMIDECNIYGKFLSDSCSVTNQREFSQDEINQALKDRQKD